MQKQNSNNDNQAPQKIQSSELNKKVPKKQNDIDRKVKKFKEIDVDDEKNKSSNNLVAAAEKYEKQ